MSFPQREIGECRAPPEVAATALSILDVPSLCAASIRGDANEVRARLAIGGGECERGVGGGDADDEAGNGTASTTTTLTPPSPEAEELMRGIFVGCEDIGKSERTSGRKRKRPGNVVGASTASPASAVVLSGAEVLRRRPDAALQALFMISPDYDAPWRAMRATIVGLRTRRGVIGELSAAASADGRLSTVALTCLSEAQLFLSTVGRLAECDPVGDVRGRSESEWVAAHYDAAAQRRGLIDILQQIVSPLYAGHCSGVTCVAHSLSSAQKCGDTKPGGLRSSAQHCHLSLPLLLVPSLFAARGRLCLSHPPIGAMGSPSSSRRDTFDDMAWMLLSARRRKDSSWEGPIKRLLQRDMILPLLSSAHDVLGYLTEEHRAYLRRLVRESSRVGSSDSGCDRSEPDFPGLARCVLKFVDSAAQEEWIMGNAAAALSVEIATPPTAAAAAAAATGTARQNSDDAPPDAPSWEDLLLHFYRAACASPRPSTVLHAESELRSALQASTSRTSRRLVRSISSARGAGDGEIPLWMRSNLLLLVADAAGKEQRALHSMIADAIGARRSGDAPPGEVDVHADATAELHRMLLEGSSDLWVGRRSSGAAVDYAELESIVIGPASEPESNGDGSDISAVCLGYSRVIRSSLSNGGHLDAFTSKEVEEHVSEHARLWMNAAETLINSSCSGENAHCMATLAITIFFTVFWEVPSLRGSLIWNIMSDLSRGDGISESPGLHRRRFSCSLVFVISCSIASSHGSMDQSEIESIKTAMSPLFDLAFGAERPQPYFLSSSRSELRREIVKKISPLPWARESILSMVKERVKVPFAGADYWMNFAGGVLSPRGSSCMPKNLFDLALDGMCILIQRQENMKEGSLDRCGIDALALLSDIIVLNNQSLPDGVRARLMQRLGVLANLGRLGEWTSRRILQAATVRLLKGYFALQHRAPRQATANGTDMVDASQMELLFMPFECAATQQCYDKRRTTRGEKSSDDELYHLFHLLLSLLQIATTTSGCKNCVTVDDTTGERGQGEVLKHLREEVMMLITEWWALAGKETKDSSPRICSKILVTDESETEDASVCLAKRCLVAVLKPLLKAVVIVPKRSAGVLVSETDRLLDCSSLLSKLAEEEEKRFSASQSGVHDSSQLLLPRWIRSLSSTTPTVPVALKNRCALNLLYCDMAAICDVTVGLILHPELLKGSYPHQRILASRAVNVLLQMRRRMRQTSVIPSETSIFLGCRSEMEFVSIASAFFDVSAENFLHLMSGEGTGSETAQSDTSQELDILSHGVVDFCEFVNEQQPTAIAANYCSSLGPKGPDITDSVSVVRSLWNLHCNVADEKSSRRFISFIERTCLARSAGEATEEAGFSLRSITSPDSVDHYVRRVRWSILSSLNRCFENLSSIPDSESVPAEGVELVFVKPGGVYLWLSIIETLCADLCGGMQGKSGGITKVLYQTYLSTIHKCISIIHGTGHAELLSLFFHQSNNLEVEAAVSALKRSSVCLWNILRHFPLKQAGQFKTTLRLPLISLSSLCHRIQLMNLWKPCKSFQPVDFDDVSIILTLSVQCFDLLKYQHKARSPKDAQPLKGIGEKNTPLSSDANTEGPYKKSPGPNQPTSTRRAVLMDKGPRKDALQDLRKVIMPSADSWSWAYISCILAAERTWTDSQKLMKAKVQSTGYPMKRPGVIQYVSIRCLELHSALRSAAMFLEEVKNEWNPVDSITVDQSIGAELLPSSLKVRLSSFLERAAVTLKLSVHIVTSSLNSTDAESVPPNDWDKVRLYEATACILAWLLPVFRERPGAKEFTAGARRWHEVELEKSTNSESPSSAGPNLSRLQKTVCRIEELNAAVESLYSSILRASTEAGGASSCTLQLFDSFIQAISSEATGKGLFLGTVKKHVSQLEGNKPEMRRKMPRDELEEAGGSTGKKRVRRAGKVQKRVLRSRNKLVDEWLSLDAQIGDGEKQDDAFVDLEDFLVEG